jgi:hypothetical protein
MSFVKIKKTGERNLLIWWLSWYFWKMPGDLLKIIKNFLKFGLNYFSIPTLMKTLFAPWRQYRSKYPRGFDFKEYASVFFGNLLSRILGFIARIFLIVIALVFEGLILISGIFIFLGWFLVVPTAIILIIWGIKWIIKI